MDDIVIIDAFTSALGLPTIEHDFTRIVRVPKEKQVEWLAAGTYPIKIVHDWFPKRDRIVEAVTLFNHRLLTTEEVNRAIGAGNRTTLHIDISA